jgi:mxaJ protein
MLYGDYNRPNPPAAIVNAVATGEVDVAAVWGPLAGCFAGEANVPLSVIAVPAFDGPEWPMTFDVSVAVRKGNDVFRQEIDTVLDRNRGEIDALLAKYCIPRLP